MADALSRKAELAALKIEEQTAVSRLRTDLRDQIRKGLERDPLAKTLIQLVEEGKTRRFWIDDGLLVTKRNRLYVPRSGDLRKGLIKECHDTLWAGHPGIHRTLALLERGYYWPRMGDDVEEYFRTCLICQQDKVERAKPLGLLEPLPVPERPWESVSMDFISNLPKVGTLGSILVVVDRF